MHVLFVASELTPIAKVGGLGDVIGALPKALARMDVSVSIVIPRYAFIPTKEMRRVVSGAVIIAKGKAEGISLMKMALPRSKVAVYLVENDTYLSTGPAPYFERSAIAGAEREIERFAFFSKAVFEFLRTDKLPGDILHLNDWHTGLIASFVKHRGRELPRRIRTIFTIHNLANQGKWNYEQIKNFIFSPIEENILTHKSEDANLMMEGILNSNRVSTVSPTYAKEILTKEYGEGIEKIIRTRKKDLGGILNGIDYDFFNPVSDAFLPRQYTQKNMALGKKENKKFLQKELQLPTSDAPLFGLVSRLTPQKGIDLIVKVLPTFLKKNNAQFIFLGQGTPEYEVSLQALAKQFPTRVHVRLGFDEGLAHRIYAGSDFFLMPSRFEPCGLGQMIAMRYGTIPLVRETGGLKDSVMHQKTGFVFKQATASAFDGVLKEAVDTYQNQRGRFMGIRDRAASIDFDFAVAAKEYLKLYRSL